MADLQDETHTLLRLADLEALYDAPSGASIVKETDRLHPVYAAFVRAAPFAVLATSGPGGLDASPRGDHAGFIEIADDKTLLMPDRRGNNRLDSLRNIVADPRVGLLFLIPGVGETLRVNGRATISVAPDLRQRFAVDGTPPKTVLVIGVESVYFQCSKAVMRSGLWNSERHVARSSLPSAGEILAAVSRTGFDGEAYDATLQQRAKASLY